MALFSNTRPQWSTSHQQIETTNSPGMKIINAARFSGTVFLIAGLYAFFLTNGGMRSTASVLDRQAWLDANGLIWMVGGWLWLLAIFTWMVLLVAFMWSYLPGHRIPTMLQSGLMVISATLAIIGVIVWMNMLPFVAGRVDAENFVPIVDQLAFTFMGAGLFMGGAVTIWISYSLQSEQFFPRSWTIPGIIAGICFLPSPFLLPHPQLIIYGLIAWVLWCAFLGTRREMPNAFSEWL